MKNQENITHKGHGFVTFSDTSNPRMSNHQAAVHVGKSLGKRVRHISRSPQEGQTVHVLQYEHLYNKDMSRALDKLAKKFNTK